jgi:pyruvate/2-oxoglutarate dehydrogenase complex dihydrolipoamide dehydrogenase (E3) component
VVILGSGDIGLIMARRLTLEGVEVLGVFEIMPYANGLNRNIVQCLHDYDIPLHLSHTVVDIRGRERVTGVTVAPVDEALRPNLSRARDIECDTVLLSIGLIPENELSRRIDLRIDPVTQGPVVRSTMETSANGVFACGNVVHIHDLVDFVSQEAMLAGRSAGDYAMWRSMPADNIRLVPGDNVAYCVPQTISTDREHIVYMRVRRPMEKCTIHFGTAFRTKVKYVFPAEMVNITVTPELLEKFRDDTLTIDVVQR